MVFARRGSKGASTSQSRSDTWKDPVVGLASAAGPARFGQGAVGSLSFPNHAVYR